MSEWPGSNDYTIAIQDPRVAFRDSVLSAGIVARHPATRMPKVWTGNFAQVYELSTSGTRWAVKCFSRSTRDLQARYAEIARSLRANDLPYFVDFHLLENEMLVHGRRWPVVKMRWADGIALDKYVEMNLADPSALLSIATKLLQLVLDLEKADLAHGDLQHGNILITNQALRLVDYDGMYVPAFAGRKAPELGLPSFQHPLRSASHYGPRLDRFSLLVIYTALNALASDASLWHEFSNGDNLLFTSEDFREPSTSRLLRRLDAMDSCRQMARLLRESCFRDPLGLDLPNAETGISSLTGRTAWWVTMPPPDYKPRTTHQPSGSALGTGQPAPTTNAHVRGMVLAVACVMGGIIAYHGSAANGASLAGIAFLILLVERASAYYSLPSMQRARQLEADVRSLTNEIRRKKNIKDTAEQELSMLRQNEERQKADELHRLRAAHSEKHLSSIPVSRLSDISGIGPYVIGNLRAAGINTALDLKRRGPYVRGVGSKRGAQINARVAAWEATANRNLPRTIPADAERRIAQQFTNRRRDLTNEVGSCRADIDRSAAELRQKELEMENSVMPGFIRFFRNTL